MKAILASIFIGILLLAMTQAGTAQQAEVPTWKVGDTWAMGASNIDLAPLIQHIIENMQQQYAATGGSASANLTGTLSIYYIFKVEEVQAAQYKVKLSAGLEMNISGTMSVTQYGKTESGSLKFTFTITADGHAYFTKDTLALTKEELSGDIDFTISALSAGQTVDMTADMTFQATMTFSPALDIFNFPIKAGDNWTAESTATVTGSISGTASMSGYGTQAISQSLDATTPMSVSFECPSTADVTLEDGSVSTCYKITQSGASVGGVSPMALGGSVYYSPDRGFIVKQDLTGLPGVAGKGGGMSLSGAESAASLGSIDPMTEQEAKAGIAGIGAGGIDMALIAVVAVVVVIVIAVVVVVLVIRRGRATPVHIVEA